MATESVDGKDIPQALLDDLTGTLEPYVVALMGLARQGHPDPLQLLGSGTLVMIGAGRYVITAAHVWDAAEEYPTVCPVLTSEYLSTFQIPREHLNAHVLRVSAFGESGPDLALVALPSYAIGRIEAHKSFLNLARQRDAFFSEPRPVSLDRGLWAITGAPIELSTKRSQFEPQEEHEVSLVGGPFFGGATDIFESEGWDYIEVGANLKLPGGPSSFRGLSGGGLWNALLSRPAAGGRYRRPARMQGGFVALPSTSAVRMTRL